MQPAKIAQYGLLISLALVLSYLESLLPPLWVPGVKLGLPNLVVVFALYRLSLRSACVISFIRVVLVSILFGNGMSLAYSAAGAGLSLAVMGSLQKSGAFSSTGVSVAGGVAHNAGQILVAMAVLETSQLAFYLPPLCLFGTVAGIVIGLGAGVLVRRTPPFGTAHKIQQGDDPS